MPLLQYVPLWSSARKAACPAVIESPIVPMTATRVIVVKSKEEE